MAEPQSALNLPSVEASQDEQSHIISLFHQHSKPAKTYQRYKTTAVLMLSWEESDMNAEEEIRDLANVFTEQYQFQVNKYQIPKAKKAQVEVNRVVANFVADYQDERTLLIVYYAGHGSRKVLPEGKDAFILKGKGSIDGKKAQKTYNDQPYPDDIATWTHAEGLLRTSKDVLAIFDCCHAGALCHNRDGEDSRFEYLGACGATQVTPKPGPYSFTRALIWALGQLKDGDPFTTRTLLNKIITYENFRKDCRFPSLGDPWRPDLKDFIMICPMDRKLDEAEAEKKDSLSNSLDIRFYFSKEIVDEKIIRVAEKFREWMEKEHDLDVEYITCLGKNTPTLIAAMKWWYLFQKSKLLRQDAFPMTPTSPDKVMMPVLRDSVGSISGPTVTSLAGNVSRKKENLGVPRQGSKEPATPYLKWNMPIILVETVLSNRQTLTGWAIAFLVLAFALLASLYFNLKLLDVLYQLDASTYVPSSMSDFLSQIRLMV